MRVLVLDESLKVSEAVHAMLGARGAEMAFACSTQELDIAQAGIRPADLRIINLGGRLTAWETSRHLRALDPAAATLVLFDDESAAGIEHVASLPGVECAPRPDAAGLTALVERAVARVRGVQAANDDAARPIRFSDIVGDSPQIRDVFAKIEKVAVGDANVCISGESATGKELIARAIHEQSARADRPLVTLDCTAIPEGLMESHLFGHVRGSFTGAVEHRDGVFFALAHTGTLFIDEISELSMPLQAKLLRVIQTREFVKVGGSKPTGRTSG